MPKIDIDAIESHLKAAKEEERRVSDDPFFFPDLLPGQLGRCPTFECRGGGRLVMSKALSHDNNKKRRHKRHSYARFIVIAGIKEGYSLGLLPFCCLPGEISHVTQIPERTFRLKTITELSPIKHEYALRFL